MGRRTSARGGGGSTGATGATGATGSTGATGPAPSGTGAVIVTSGAASTLTGTSQLVGFSAASAAQAVTVGSGLSLSGGTLSGSETVYSVDFTALTPVASYSNGPATIGGQTWTFSGLGTATASLSAANGLMLTAPSGGSYNPVVVSPALAGLGASPLIRPMLLWTRLESTLSTSGGLASLVSNLLQNAGQTYVAVNRLDWSASASPGGISGSSTFQYYYNNSVLIPSNFAQSYTTTNLTHDVRVIRMVTFDRFEVWTGSWSSGWPLVSSLQYRGFVQLNLSNTLTGGTTSPYPNPGDLLYSLSAQSNGATSAATVAKLKALRIDVG